MLSNYLRLGLTCEVMAWYWLAYFILGIAPLPALLFVLTAMIVVRTAITLLITMLSRIAAPRSLHLGWRWLPLLSRELWARLYCWLFLFPWQFRREPDRVIPGDLPLQKPVTVVLIHGFVSNRTQWGWLRRRLARDGWSTVAFDLEPAYEDLDILAQRLTQKIERLPSGPLVLVCHSMGGLVARACLQRFGAGRIKAVLTIATPHQGTLIARFVPLFKNAKQMVPGNAWLMALDRYPIPVPLTSIYSEADDIVVPAASADLPGSHCIVTPPTGHMATLFSPAVATILLAELNRITRLDIETKAPTDADGRSVADR